MSFYMNRYGFWAWPLYEKGGVFKLRPAHPRHKISDCKYGSNTLID